MDTRSIDKVAHYREILHDLVTTRASHRISQGEIKAEAVIDLKRDHYEVMHVGWQGHRRIHGCVIHLDIIDGKVWIQYDGTDEPVAEDLLEAGVPKEDIVLGFHPADVRSMTEFAVA